MISDYLAHVKPNRRQFFQTAGVTLGAFGLAGCAANGKATPPLNQFGGSTKPIGKPERSTVGFSAGTDQYVTTSEALKPLQAEVAKAIGKRRVMIKVNSPRVSSASAFCSTHPEQLHAILDFLRPIYDGEITISEGTGGVASSVMDAYENYGYRAFDKDYKLRFIDANEQSQSRLYLHSSKMYPVPINVNYPYMDPDIYLISAARMKTHDTVVATLSMKNVVMGAPQTRFWLENTANRSDKPKMHGVEGIPDGGRSGRDLSWNLFTLALAGVRPDLGVIDGVESVAGDGPWGAGFAFKHGVAVASTDFVAADRIGFELMGVDPFYMKYLEWCDLAGLGNFNIDSIDVVGPNYRDHIVKYQLHSQIDQEIAWIDRNFTR